MPFLPSRRSEQNFGRSSFKTTPIAHTTLVEEPELPTTSEEESQHHQLQHVVESDAATAKMSFTNNTSSGQTDDERRNRIVFLGSGKVGKTSLIRRFLENSYNDKYRPTVEDIFTREYEINGRLVSVEIMDTSGSYNFPAMRRICIGKASAFVLVCAQNDQYSFEYVRELLRQIKEERSDYDDTPLVIAVNKIDLPEERQVSDEEIDAWLHEESVGLSSLVYTSAKEEDGVWTIFEKLWEKNDANHPAGLPFPEVKPPVSTKRRFSAFAVLTTTPGPLLRGSISGASTNASTPEETSHSHWPLTPKRSNKPKSGRRFSNKFSSSGRSAKPDGPVKVDCVIS